MVCFGSEKAAIRDSDMKIKCVIRLNAKTAHACQQRRSAKEGLI